MTAPVAIFLVVVAGFLIWIYGGGMGDSGAPTSCDTPCCTMDITNDPLTWPSGDRYWLVCHAIALAEGADKAGSNPDRLNNPGDISDGYHTYGGEYHSGSYVTQFPDKATGWEWFHHKVMNIANGQSSEYAATDTWATIAQKWSGDWKNWVTNVTAVLGVDPQSTFADYMQA